VYVAIIGVMPRKRVAEIKGEKMRRGMEGLQIKYYFSYGYM